MADDEDEDRCATPHDRLARRILSQPEAAGVELRHVLPKVIAERLDFANVRIEPGTFVDPKLDEGRSDILYSIPIEGTAKRVLVYVLLEHQSQPNPMMPWRLLQYLVWIWERCLRAKRGKARTLPFIIPVVLAQCEHGWTAPYRLSELFDLPDELRATFGAPVELELLVDELDESVMNDQVARDGVAALVELMRVLLMAHHHGDRFTEDQLAELTSLFQAVTDAFGRSAARPFWVYVVSVFGPRSRFRDMLLEVIDQEQRTMYDAVREEWLAVYQPEWLVKHKEALLAEGEARGRAEAKAELILALLEQRGLGVPAVVRERVLGTTDELQLQRWFERAVTAGSLDEVFEPAR